MKMKLSWFVVLMLLMIACLAGWTGYAQKQSAAPQQSAAPPRTVWEYKIVSESDKLSLNDLGAQGWELVAVEMGGAQEVYFFKRPK